MGVPKFFRWVSERYPMCSQLITENQIPEFDNLYLDMNGIIHSCSHPNDDKDVHFRLSEEQIFMGIFNYIDHLFAKIKPNRLFFMAVDGVAPRAKMNQQQPQKSRAAKKGDLLPDDPQFDSNCITPGTAFMARLSDQLKYFVNKKVSEDRAWQGIEIILSGHEVPGEGEHKIMEYLRFSKSQTGYNPNVRHCIYGLDADLVMLGLLSHEPHFALLREEVTFGRTKKKTLASSNPESQNFYLMHLSILREYLDMEFQSCADTLPFTYDLERILDDFILMAFFVGNDFLPSLPGLHINQGALSFLFKEYREMLPELGGYINDGGRLNLERCEVLIKKLGEIEMGEFEEEVGDLKWLDGKRGVDHNRNANHKSRKIRLEMNQAQEAMYKAVKSFVLENEKDQPPIIFNATHMPARDRSFITKIARDFGLKTGVLALNAKSKHTNIFIAWPDDEDSDEEGVFARTRMFSRYDDAVIIDEDAVAANMEKDKEVQKQEELVKWKESYYKNKLHFDFSDPEPLREMIFQYVQGLQWVLFYYYDGVPSWEWFYPYHYAPKITDIQGFSHYNLVFDKGVPFFPYQQLMGVLPAASKAHVPEPYRDLMTEVISPIIDFYPVDFECDQNGKRASWEAVVLIPFIDEKRLLAAMESRDKMLSKNEKKRNSFGVSTKFWYDSLNPHTFPSTLPGVFSDIENCQCKMSDWVLPTIGKFGFIKTLCKGVTLGLPGFPSLSTIPHTAVLGHHSVNIFNAESANESMILSLKNQYQGLTPEDVLRRMGKTVYYGYPFLTEAKVETICDELFTYKLEESQLANGVKRIDVVKTAHTRENGERFNHSAEASENFYSKKYGAITGPVDVIVTVLPLKGMLLKDDGALIKEFVGRGQEKDIPLITIVESVEEVLPKPVTEDFPLGSSVFLITSHPDSNGSYGEVFGHQEESVNVKYLKSTEPKLANEMNFTRDIAQAYQKGENYTPSFVLAKHLNLPSLVLARVTSSLQVVTKKGNRKISLGLNLKFDGKQKKVLGYTKKGERGWEFSVQAKILIAKYQKAFPDFFAGLIRNPSKDVYEDLDFFPIAHAEERMADILAWLKDEKVKDLDQVSLETYALPRAFVHRIEKEIDETYASSDETKFRIISVKNVPRHALLKPEHAKYRLSHQTFDLGERVVHVADSGKAPIGAKGTIIGIEGLFLEVLFDKPFLSATSLEHRCSENRGLYIAKNSVINLTRAQPPTTSIARPNVEAPNISTRRQSSGGYNFKQNGNNNIQSFSNQSYGSSSSPPQNRWQKGSAPNFGGGGGQQQQYRNNNGNSGRNESENGYNNGNSGRNDSGNGYNNSNAARNDSGNSYYKSNAGRNESGNGYGGGRRGGDSRNGSSNSISDGRGRGRGKGWSPKNSPNRETRDNFQSNSGKNIEILRRQAMSSATAPAKQTIEQNSQLVEQQQQSQQQQQQQQYESQQRQVHQQQQQHWAQQQEQMRQQQQLRQAPSNPQMQADELTNSLKNMLKIGQNNNNPKLSSSMPTQPSNSQPVVSKEQPVVDSQQKNLSQQLLQGFQKTGASSSYNPYSIGVSKTTTSYVKPSNELENLVGNSAEAPPSRGGGRGGYRGGNRGRGRGRGRGGRGNG